VRHAYFPRGSALAVFLVLMENGEVVETTMVGREGALGGIVSQGNVPCYARSCVMHEGDFYRIATTDLELAKEQSPQIRHLFARYADCVMAQVFQSVACNASHTIEQRAAKWLCAALDRTGKDEIAMTQEQLASMMGIGRSYASRVVQRFKADGLIKTRRGGLRVLDPEGLRARACSCNEMVKQHFDTVLSGVYPD
jgi:CRP-like cAMP-binding protein